MKTFYHYSETRFPLVVHDDGSLDFEDICLLQEHFVNCRVASKKAADRTMAIHLKDYPACSMFRFDLDAVLSLKFFDPFFYSNSAHVMVMDSDVLLFRKPAEIINPIKNRTGFCMNDYQDAYTLSVDDLDSLLGKPVGRNINSGLFCLSREDYDLGLIEEFFRISEDKGCSPRCWAEQTAFELLFSAQGEVFKRLGEAYQISGHQDSRLMTVQ